MNFPTMYFLLKNFPSDELRGSECSVNPTASPILRRLLFQSVIELIPPRNTNKTDESQLPTNSRTNELSPTSPKGNSHLSHKRRTSFFTAILRTPSPVRKETKNKTHNMLINIPFHMRTSIFLPRQWHPTYG